jgi:hypothetical protein
MLDIGSSSMSKGKKKKKKTTPTASNVSKKSVEHLSTGVKRKRPVEDANDALPETVCLFSNQ